MLKQKEIVERLVKKFPEIKMIIQFGSSASGDYVENLSDIDLAIISKSKKEEEQIKDFIFKEVSSFYLQTHLFSINSFVKSLKDGVPLSLSILYTGNPLYGHEDYFKLKKKGFKANKSTMRKCMLNSFAALSLAISDLTGGMLFDSVNSVYHAARSSIWAVLITKEITPKNKRILELVEDRKIIDLYKKIISFRQNIPDYDIDIDFSKKLYKKGDMNPFTQILRDAMMIIKINHKHIFKKNFIGLFELLSILKGRYKIPNFYSIFLSVDWKKEIPSYHVMLSFKYDKRFMLEVNAHNGKIKELSISESK